MAQTTVQRPLPRESTEYRAKSRVSKVASPTNIALYILLVLLALFFVLPLLWMLSTSLKEGSAVFTDQGWIPANPSFGNFETILNPNSDVPVYRFLLNSVVTSALGTILTVLFTSLSAYAFARIDFPGKNILFTLLITTLLLPGVMFLTGQFLIVNQLGLLNTIPAFIAPGLAGVFGVFFMRQFFLGIPVELEEAARLDGANQWQIFWKVVLPLSKAALATLALLSFLTNWNDFLWPIYVLFSPEMQTLPAGLSTLQSANAVRYDLLMAGAVVASVPVLLLLVFLQRFLIEGVARSGLKG